VFLTNPTIEELQALDMSVLLDMLTYQTSLLLKLIKSDGVSGTVYSSEQLIINIQTAIESKKQLEKNSRGVPSEISFSRESRQDDKPQ